jgi:hypothetical protein
MLAECPLLAEDCLLPGLYGRLLWRKLPLELDESAAIVDPFETPIKKATSFEVAYILFLNHNPGIV